MTLAGGTAAAIALAGLPILIATVLAVGIPSLIAAITHPRVALVFLLLSIPFGGWVTVSAGNFRVAPTDILVATLAIGWVVRTALAGKQPRLFIGPMIALLMIVFMANLLSAMTAEEFPDAAKELIKLAEMIVIAIYASSALNTKAETRFAVLALLAVGGIEALVGLRQFITRSGPEFFALGPFMRAYGDFGQPNALAGYLGMLLPWGIVMSLRAGSRRRWIWLLTTLVICGIGATWSRGAWLGSLLGLALMAMVWSKETRRALVVASGVVGVLAILGLAGLLPATLIDRFTVIFENFFIFDVRGVEVTPANWSLVERMAHWQTGWNMALDHPWLGVGPGNYGAAYPRYDFKGWLEALGHAHNYYINTFAETGIVGLVVLLSFMMTIYAYIGRALRRTTNADNLKRAVLIAMLGSAVTLHVHNTFDNMLVHGIEVQFALMLGLATAAGRWPSERDSESEA